MPIEMPVGLPFSVDTWTPTSLRKRHHFLTHAHKDHLTGIVVRASRPIYATRLTKNLALHYFPRLDDSLFVEIEVGESVVVDDPDGAFSVTAFDANHCPGAVMFLFEGRFGNLLHTGDCRLTPDCLQNLPLKYIVKKGRETLCHLDYLFLDCTFSRCCLKMPNKQSAIQQVISCIWKHPNAPVVYLSCDLLGREEILVEVSKTFGSNIFVDKSENSDCFQALFLAAPEILTEDASSRFQVLPLSKLYDKASEELANARASFQPEPLFIRPSVQWYAIDPNRYKSQKRKKCPAEAERDEFGVWHVCHSMHSSREELEWALQFLQPKWVISTTPPSRAMDLDYVKNHCYKTHISSDDPLWKLFKGCHVKSIPSPPPSASEVLKNNDASIFITKVSTSEINQLQPETSSQSQFEVELDLSPPSRTQPFTLFGRARLGHKELDIIRIDENSIVEIEVESFAAKHDTLIEQPSSCLGCEITCSVKVSSAEIAITDSVSYSMEEQIVEQSFSNQSDDTVNRRVESSNGYSKKALSICEPCIVKSGVDVKSDIWNITEPEDDKMGTLPNLDKLDEQLDVRRDMLCIGSSSSFNPSLRNLYRSMNVPVPRPLPSLAELMESCKRAKNVTSSDNTGSRQCYTTAAFLPS
ncbi:uncharacterized protein LOC135649469 isoform X1 [Musa acuminata AAA Group]|uniref:uncharacterized protein LOC135649469 isoform X1 n=1 Tax=Musa acuminata AAA Group TaxID=214697 RepID=UPI0031D5359C